MSENTTSKLLELLLIMEEAKNDLYIKVNKPLDPKYCHEQETFDELIAQGKSFKEINKIMKGTK